MVQAIVNNLAPLFFIIFSERYSISYAGLGSLVMLNFLVQLIVDALCIKLAARIGYKKLLVLAQALSALGLVFLGILPLIIAPIYTALVMAVVVYALGGGLLEVLVSPVVDALPGEAEQKPAAMSLLHSFYCWGQMAVILLSTFLLSIIGLDKWYILPILWSLVPMANMFFMIWVPIVPAIKEKDAMGLRGMAKAPVFFVCLLMMLCAGASEQAVAQWASLFAEKALGVPKVMGDVFGPAMFALFMGLGRVIHGIWGGKMNLFAYMLFCSILCIFCYLGITLVPHPVVQLVACALTGFAVSIMWPAAFSLSSARFPMGGAALFAVLALMGDMGCSSGPWIVGLVTDAASGNAPIQTGILVCIIFPIVFLITIFFLKKQTVNAKH
ncbi:hypothetical protein FACS189447_10080 [Spirochaetia bacterium]|nr:hypothetical protein FACS189447_10080 [Spirochaetia bacterium]